VHTLRFRPELALAHNDVRGTRSSLKGAKLVRATGDGRAGVPDFRAGRRGGGRRGRGSSGGGGGGGGGGGLQ